MTSEQVRATDHRDMLLTAQAVTIRDLRAEVERLRMFVQEIADPDNWEHVDEAHWQYYGFPPFETAAMLLGRAKAT